MSELKKWGHDQLANDLAEHLSQNSDRIIWTDMQLGPSGSPRPDVYSIPKSYSGFKPIAYECKVSVSDFRSDITKGKWQSYLKYSSGVVFAVPKGLITKDDVPKGCGLIVRSENGWRMVKGPTLTTISNDLPKEYWIKLVIDGVNRSLRDQRKHQGHEYRARRAISEKYGEELGQVLARRDQSIEMLNYKTKEVKKQLGDIDLLHHADRQRKMIEADKQAIERMHHELCGYLGLPEGSSDWDIRATLKKQRDLLNKDGQIQQCQGAINKAVDSLKRQLGELERLSVMTCNEVIEL